MPDNGLERYRSALLLLARTQLARHKQLGLEASDLVQQTFVEACRDMKQFRGGTDWSLSPGQPRVRVDYRGRSVEVGNVTEPSASADGPRTPL